MQATCRRRRAAGELPARGSPAPLSLPLHGARPQPPVSPRTPAQPPPRTYHQGDARAAQGAGQQPGQLAVPVGDVRPRPSGFGQQGDAVPCRRTSRRGCWGALTGTSSSCSHEGGGPLTLTQCQEAAVDVVGLHGELPTGAGLLHPLAASQVHEAQRALLAGAGAGLGDLRWGG